MGYTDYFLIFISITNRDKNYYPMMHWKFLMERSSVAEDMKGNHWQSVVKNPNISTTCFVP